MQKLLLLDADVIIDLHVMNLFNKLSKSYAVMVTSEVLREANYYKKGGRRLPINIENIVLLITLLTGELLIFYQIASNIT